MTEKTTITVCPAAELKPGERRIVETGAGEVPIGVFNIEGELFAIEDRCSHDDGPLAEGEVDAANCTLECPRHGSLFDLRTGKALTLPAFQPVDVYPISIVDDNITLEV